ncbi:GH92 family glycosyl hydrolase [Parabacteroides pacaensis]|uniref:GH92 family glycosyl hydrolase n=1 Tax=Parabacteroides pacaensis TaxID=2086575 RepID=UPI000D110E71|nr:GH92 family glycosyl hydrolase [Parabacteroides pacaensis]
MKKMLTNLGFLFAVGLFSCQPKEPGAGLSDYVNPFIGASTNTEAAGAYHGLGKTIPGATTPFGLVQLSPNTITGGDNGSGYSYEHTSIEGFAFTQMSGIGWFGDLGNFLVMPTTGKMKTSAGTLDNPDAGYRSRYNKETEKATAGYYEVELADYGIKAELTAAPHSGMIRFTYPENKQSRIQIDLARRVGGTSTFQEVEVVDDHTIAGRIICAPEGGGWGNGEGNARYTVFFYAQFSKPFTNYGIWSAAIPDTQSRKREDIESAAYQQLIAQSEIIPGVKKQQGKHLGFYTEFETQSNEEVLIKAGISFVSLQGAQRNLETDIPDWDFDKTYENARRLWDAALSKMEIKGGTDEQKRVFYTSLYRTMIDPRKIADVGGNYPGGDNIIHATISFSKYSIFSGWDVFRSQMPLQTIINPDVVNDLLNSLITLADESGREYFERWEFLNSYTGCMLGNPAISVLADAYAKGIRKYDVKKAYQYAVNSAEKFGNGELGYTPGPLGISYTLEYGYTEWCLSELARQLGKTDDQAKYLKRSAAYRNIFDKEKNSFRPRLEDGNFAPWPEEGRLKEWYGCIECNPYQQGWFVPQDISGLTELMGGRERVIADLDDMFAKTPDNFLWNQYYNHANEPVHHVPYLYNRLGEPWKTQKWTRYICDKAYKNAVEGLVGNEDVGQMSAWYVLSACGIHPICPGDTRMEITSPVFDQIKINLSEEKSFTITAKNNSPENVYIQSAELNGKKHTRCYLDYQDIMQGGTLKLIMGSQPNPDWGVTE